MPAGAPSKYKKEFCERVIEIGKTGASKAEMAVELGISRASFDNYEKEFPEFLEAVREAITYSQVWWEKNGRIATFGAMPNFNATTYIFNMKNRFKDDWRDKVEQEVTGANGGPIEHKVTKVEFIDAIPLTVTPQISVDFADGSPENPEGV